MYRTLIAAAAFAVVSFGAVNISQAQQWNTVDEFVRQVQAPSEDVQGQPTGEEKEGDAVEAQDRFWIIYSPYCWSRWVYVGYNYYGRPLYRRYVWCR